MCEGNFTSRKELLGHLRTAPGEHHELLRRQGMTSQHHPTLLTMGVICCPKACGSYFDGGTSNTSKPLAAHVATNKCRSRQSARHNMAREVNGSFLPTTMGGIHAALDDRVGEATVQPNMVAPHAPTINFCLMNPTFTMEHLRTSGAQYASSIPSSSKALVTSTFTSLFR